MKKNKSLSNFEMHNSSVSSKNAIHKRTKDEEAIYAETSEKIWKCQEMCSREIPKI